jgi:hypothetical protein
MKRMILLLLLTIYCIHSTDASDSALKREIPCKTKENANLCYWTHGRLGMGNGTPSYRLWKIGSHRVLGIYSGPSVDRYGLDSEGPELPSNVVWKLWETKDTHFANRIFGDFEVCPLEPEKRGVMQAACIESAKNIVIEK